MSVHSVHFGKKKLNIFFKLLLEIRRSKLSQMYDQRYCIFFCWESLRVIHSLDFRKSWGKKTAGIKKVFFFPRKSLTALTQSKSEAGKKQLRKNKQNFHSLTRILPKSGQKQTFPRK